MLCESRSIPISSDAVATKLMRHDNTTTTNINNKKEDEVESHNFVKLNQDFIFINNTILLFVCLPNIHRPCGVL